MAGKFIYNEHGLYDGSGLKLLIDGLDALAEAEPKIGEKMINTALPVLEKEIKSNISKINFSERSTGALVRSIKIKNAHIRKKSIQGDVHFTGKDKKGTRNGLKAGVLEYGKAGQAPTAFLRSAVAQSSDKCIKIMENVFEEETKKIIQ